MRSGPRESNTIFGRDSAAALFGIGGLIALVTVAAYAIGQSSAGDDVASRMTLATLVGAQLSASLAFRSQTRSVFQLPRNLWLLAAIAASALTLIVIFYVPLLKDAFSTGPISLAEWLIVLALSLVPLIVVEAAKLSGLARRLLPPQAPAATNVTGTRE
jgi:Ca2+-transporting ATPase